MDAREFIEEVAESKGCFTAESKREAEEEARNGRKGMLRMMKSREETRQDLEKMLDILSNDLYSSRARFLMEVIQNADDNNYVEGEIPTLSISVFPQHVKIECNEVGFSEKNIWALCRTGRSSKPPGQGFTGEKGIGFKSLFKTCKRVHVRSPPYYFELDKTRKLGMITPQWDKDFFDDYDGDLQTTIIMDHICGESKSFSAALKRDIKLIDPVLILFLRRLDRLHLTLFNPSSDDCGIVSLKDEIANRTYRFYKHRFSVDFWESEARRPDVTNTDIVLAFPMNRRTSTYKTFAFLPIGNFGFKFVIQADFLLTSNRESVDEDTPWNQNIAVAIPRAFRAAVDEFNEGDSDLHELARTWPLYLRNDSSGLSPYWSSITRSISEYLRTAEVLKDRNGGLSKPNDLMFLDWAHGRDGEPMLGQMYEFISPDYPSSAREALLSLGVNTPTWEWMCKQLHSLEDEGLLIDHLGSQEWFSDLAKMFFISSGHRNDRECARDITRITLIPLSDGTWRCPPSTDDPIYFPTNSGVSVPPGLPLSLVDEKMCTCPERKRLFRVLGVEDCTTKNVVKRIFDHHTKFESETHENIIAQVKYLYKMRDSLQPDDLNLKKIHFSCSGSLHRHGISIYADVSDEGQLRQLFSDYNEAYFLNGEYFADLDDSQTAEFAQWLHKTAGVALAPRLVADTTFRLHSDFEWLLKNQSDLILGILKQNWSIYGKCLTGTAKDTLAGHEVICQSGRRTALRNSYLPLPSLLTEARAVVDVDGCDFVALPSGEAANWKFLSRLDVGVEQDLDFYLWILKQSKQPDFQEHTDVDKSTRLFREIQSRTFSPTEVSKVRDAFDDVCVKFPNSKLRLITSCVWEAPRGYSLKPALHSVYGDQLDRLFREILRVRNVTGSEAFELLNLLRSNRSTTMAEAAEVYAFVQTHCADSFSVNDTTACIAVPSSSGSALAWKTPAECVWDDDEFSQNGLELESKTSLRRIVEQRAPSTRPFFTQVLKLKNADMVELMTDLMWMSDDSDEEEPDPDRVYLLYKRIQSSCGRWFHFRNMPLVFLWDTDSKTARWLSLEDCIWTPSILRNKHALEPSLRGYQELFQDTLDVQNATMDMLVNELLGFEGAEGEDDYQYVKDLLLEIARFWENSKKTDQLDDEALQRIVYADCWPCRTSDSSSQLCWIGEFWVSDRQDLFDIFSDSHTILDFGFDDSKKLSGLLRYLGCDKFLSERVTEKTDHCGMRQRNHSLTQDLRDRCSALVKYFESEGCQSPYNLRSLLQNLEVWSADILVHYTLKHTTKTKSEGGSSVKVTGKHDAKQLIVHISVDKAKRDCALVTDFPGQLIAELRLEPANLPHLQSILLVPIASLNILLIRIGITCDDISDGCKKSSADGLIETDDATSDESATASQVAFDMSRLTLLEPESIPATALGRSAQVMDRHAEIGFGGERFVFELLHDMLELPEFTAENNWTSQSRSRAGESDFIYEDRQGVLTRKFQQMQHSYATPEWLSTALDRNNVPTYHIEVKTTTSTSPTATFYMSGYQYQLAKRLRVTSATPSEIYVILRVSSSERSPQWRVYLDPYTLGYEGLLDFAAPHYEVKATA